MDEIISRFNRSVNSPVHRFEQADSPRGLMASADKGGFVLLNVYRNPIRHLCGPP